MSSEQIFAPAGTRQLEPFPHDLPPGGDPDPLAKITLTPRGFAGLMAIVGLLLGLILAIIPVHVTAPDPARAASVSCGNTIGGVESGSVAANLDRPDRATMVSYIAMCESTISDRVFYSWPMFFAGGIGIIWLGVVRRRQPLGSG
jgi:hypothetical protein